MSDAPTRDVTDYIGETRAAFWELGRMMPHRPEGTDENYRPPARFYLDRINTARAALEEAEQMAKEEIPEQIKREADQHTRRFGPCVVELAEHHPELRRFWQVRLIRDLVEDLFDNLANEGRPQPAPDLRLGRMRH